MQQQMCAAQSTAYFHIGHAMLASLNILAVLSLTFWYGVQDESNTKPSKLVSTKFKYCLFNSANQLQHSG